MKYRIVDLSCYSDDEIQNLEGGWYEDYDTGQVCYDFVDVHEFVSSLLFNMEEVSSYEDYKIAIANLLEYGYCEVNGFRYEVED